MPRFSIKSLLIATAVIALWLSTFIGFAATAALRESILLLVIVLPAFAVAYFRGRRRAFWAAFLVVLWLFGFRNWHQFIPFDVHPLDWQVALSRRWASLISNANNQEDIASGISATIRVLWQLAFAMAAGLVAAHIYDQSQQDKDG